MKHYFLGLAANYSLGERIIHTFAVGTKRDCENLAAGLEKKYRGKAILCKNGRSALALAFKAYFEPGDGVIVNGFTCYAVYEAIKAAKLVPVFADISKDDLNYSIKTLMALDTESEVSRHASSRPSSRGSSLTRSPLVAKCLETSNSCVQIRGIIIQNTLGNPVDIKAVEKFAKEHDLVIIEDLAHCAGMKYRDGREAGTVGAATALSFGKDKSIDTISGGALVLRAPSKHEIKAPEKLPKLSDHLRARFYPLFGITCRGLSYINLGGALMRLLIKIHWVEKSADNSLDLERKPSKFEAKLALKQLKSLRASKMPLREFYLVEDRLKLLKELKKAGFYLDGFWYERPVSPRRYYNKVHFPEEKCPNATFVAEHIVNLPRHYKEVKLAPARKIIKKYLIEEGK